MMDVFDTYIRVSKKDGRSGESYITIPEQRKRNSEVALSKNVKLGVEVVEEDVSGSKRAADRSLEMLIQRAERGESAGIIVAYQDRLSRGSLLEQAEIWERLEKAGARFIAGDGVDSALPGQELLFAIKAAIARDQWKRLKQGFDTTRKNAIERGVYIGPRIPVGYSKDESKRLRPNDDKKIAQRAFKMRLNGESYNTIRKFLREHGCNYSTVGVSDMLSSTVYLGWVQSGEFINKKAHKPIIDRVTFEAVQVKKRPTKTPSGLDYSIRGLLVCSGCGLRLTGHTSYYGPKGQRVKDKYYHCPGTSKDGECFHRSGVRGSEAEAYVEKMFWTYLVTTLYENDPQRDTQEIEEANLQLADAEHALKEVLTNSKLVTVLGVDEYATMIETHKLAVEAAKIEVGRYASRNEMLNIQTNLAERWSTLAPGLRRKILAREIDRVIVLPAKRGLIPLERRLEIVRVDGTTLATHEDDSGILLAKNL